MMDHLCAYCRQIPFSTLRSPTAAELIAARHAQRNKLPNFRSLHFRSNSNVTKESTDTSAETPVPLGLVSRILHYDGPCELCRLFRRIIRQRGVRYLHDRPIPENDDNICIEAAIDREYFGYISESIMDVGSAAPDGLILMRRLSLRIRYKNDTISDGVLIENWRILTSYNKVLQICHPGDFVPSSDPLRREKTELGVNDGGMLFRGRMRPDVVDLDLLRRWMSICENDHDVSCCSDEEISEDHAREICVELIRFIDVERNCLCVLRDIDIAKASNKFTALSYVWGKAVQVKLLGENESDFQVEDSLSTAKLPETIADAIHLTRRLDIKYLWVDVLCICQGQTDADLRDRQYQLSNMGNIYRSASLTIIAACSGDANAGLIGLRPNQRENDQTAVTIIPPNEELNDLGLALVSTCNQYPPWTGDRAAHKVDDDELDVSVWASRAWTFQERCLSRRCLIFTKAQVFWVCDGALFCEESHFEPPGIYHRNSTDTPLRIELFKQNATTLAYKTIDGPLSRLMTTSRTFWNKFNRLVVAYSNTDMSFDGDIYDAFQGIAEAFTRVSGEQFHWGHPRSRFGISVAWSSPAYYYKLHRRTERTTLPMTSLGMRVQLPSWSWMGWLGAAHVSVGNEVLETETLDILYYSHQSNPVRINRIEGSNDLDNKYSGVALDKIHKGQKRTTLLGHDEIVSEVTWNDIQKHHPNLTESRLSTVPDGHLLFFWASSASLVVEDPKTSLVNEESLSELSRAEDERKPAVSLTSGLKIGTVDRMDAEHWNSSPDPSGLQEFVVISRKEVREMAEDFPADVAALQIRWEDGIAYRVNIAEFKEADWMEAKPTWKLIPLM